MVESPSKLEKLIKSKAIIIQIKIDKTPRIKNSFIDKNKRSRTCYRIKTRGYSEIII